MSSILSSIRTSFARARLDPFRNINKKGARRRIWWHGKILGNRMYKGYGAGGMMRNGRIDQDRVRTFVVADGGLLKPYVDESGEGTDASAAANQNKNRVTMWDYVKRMEEEWDESKREVFAKYYSMICDKKIGQKEEKLSRYGA